MKVITLNPTHPRKRDIFPMRTMKLVIEEYAASRIQTLEAEYQMLDGIQHRFGTGHEINGKIEELEKLQEFLEGMR